MMSCFFLPLFCNSTRYGNYNESSKISIAANLNQVKNLKGCRIKYLCSYPNLNFLKLLNLNYFRIANPAC